MGIVGEVAFVEPGLDGVIEVDAGHLVTQRIENDRRQAAAVGDFEVDPGFEQGRGVQQHGIHFQNPLEHIAAADGDVIAAWKLDLEGHQLGDLDAGVDVAFETRRAVAERLQRVALGMHQSVCRAMECHSERLPVEFLQPGPDP